MFVFIACDNHSTLHFPDQTTTTWSVCAFNLDYVLYTFNCNFITGDDILCNVHETVKTLKANLISLCLETEMVPLAASTCDKYIATVHTLHISSAIIIHWLRGAPRISGLPVFFRETVEITRHSFQSLLMEDFEFPSIGCGNFNICGLVVSDNIHPMNAMILPVECKWSHYANYSIFAMPSTFFGV